MALENIKLVLVLVINGVAYSWSDIVKMKKKTKKKRRKKNPKRQERSRRSRSGESYCHHQLPILQLKQQLSD